MSKFYQMYQNNSGGYIIQNENVDRFVIIEANTLEEFRAKASIILEDYREYCECCGERWDDEDMREKDGTDKPTIYGIFYKNFNDTFWTREENCIIYYLDGTKEKWTFGKE